MTAEARVAYERHQGPTVTQAKPISIGQSGDFRVWRFFEAADMMSTGLALIVSIVSGVALYALAPTFGSAKDYLALFTWGAGLDQGKNFIQSLAIYSSTNKTAT